MTEFNPFSPEYNMTELDDAPDFTNSRIVMRKIDNNDGKFTNCEIDLFVMMLIKFSIWFDHKK